MWNKIKKSTLLRCVIILGGAAVFLLIAGILYRVFWYPDPSDSEVDLAEKVQQEGIRRVPKMDFDVRLLTPNRFSRPQLKLKRVNAVVVHYTSNPGTDAIDNRNYFNNLPDINADKATPTFASSHFIIGLDGNIVQCIPLSEIAYASNSRNDDTISIECCHPTKSGKFTYKTYEALMDLLAYLCLRYDLDPSSDIIRHYDITGKMCPRYYVKNPQDWIKLVADAGERTKKVREELKKPGTECDYFDKNGKKIE